jgi:KaiC/GvpD/RAD55 family RecA-like ATPase
MRSGEVISLEHLVEMFGGYSAAVDAVMNLGRAMWTLAFTTDQSIAHKHNYRIINIEHLLKLLNDRSSGQQPDTASLYTPLLNDLRAKRIIWEHGAQTRISLSVFRPLTLVRTLLAGIKPDHELRYFVMRSIRKHYECVFAPETAHVFHLLADSVNTLSTLARYNSVLLSITELRQPINLLIKLRDAGDPVSKYIREQFSADMQQELGKYDESLSPSNEFQQRVVEELNRLLKTDHFYNRQYFTNEKLSNKTRKLISKNPQGDDLIRLNRMLLVDAYPREISKSNNSASPRLGSDTIWNYQDEFLPYLDNVLSRDSNRTDKLRDPANLFIECCCALGYLRPHYKKNCVDLRTSSIDAEYLLSNLFGISTRIRGFDELFGGGGLILSEAVEPSHSDQISGRTVLILGRFGTGKSLLSLQIAVEVARKGGIAWMMPLEQSPQEYLYVLESMRLLPDKQSVIIAKDLNEAMLALKKTGEHPERGVLILLKTIKDSFKDFLESFAENAKEMEKYPIRVISVDPVNSINRDPNAPANKLRIETMKMIEKVKGYGASVMLVAEEGNDSKGEFLFEQNIADTVIHLSVAQRHGYAQRYLEIMKSRLQREQRGMHPFSIVPGEGIRIYPSSAAVSARIRPRTPRHPNKQIEFGLSSLDDMLGEKGLNAGDVIVFQGSGGSFKTPLGLLFLLGSDWGSTGSKRRPFSSADPSQRQSVSLLVSARDSEFTIKHMLIEGLVDKDERLDKRKKIDAIKVLSLPRGHVHPSYIIQSIEDEFLKARLGGYEIDRVMVDNIAHWEMSCPFVREDETFGDTLVDLLRRYRVTSLLTCGELSQDIHSVVQRSIIDNADCVIQFDRIEFRGMHRVMIRALKTRGMRHRRESFELTLGVEGIRVKPTSSLLRVLRGGEVAPVKIRLFLYSETDMQQEYNQKFLSTVRAILSREAEIEPQDRVYMSRAMHLGSSSAVDELQLFQLDEFQVPSTTEREGKEPALYCFAATQWNAQDWDDFLPPLAKRIRTYNNGFFAIPFYENLSLLAYRQDVLEEGAVTTWHKLAEQCTAWENKHKDPGAIFFDFPRGTGENLNCLFFEILLTVEYIPNRSGQCRLRNWLRSPSAIEAAKIFRRLCRRAYLASLASDQPRQGQSIAAPLKVNPDAIAWRHWYSTLNQMLSTLDLHTREKIRVGPLPGNVVVAGEWYLGIPAYSAAPDVGLEMIKLLTSHETELDRMHKGVGLPTRQSLYNAGMLGTSVTTDISPFFDMDIKYIKEFINTAFRRSKFGCYSQLSSLLSSHLQKIIEIPGENEDMIEGKIQKVLESLEGRMEFLRSDRDCSMCRIKTHIIH